jgi:hypothetical protein
MGSYEIRTVKMTFIEGKSKEDAIENFKKRYGNNFDFIDAESVYGDDEEKNNESGI